MGRYISDEHSSAVLHQYGFLTPVGEGQELVAWLYLFSCQHCFHLWLHEGYERWAICLCYIQSWYGTLPKVMSLAPYGCIALTSGSIQPTRMMTTTLAEAKIRVNCVAPGIFPSEMTAGSLRRRPKSKLDLTMSNPAGTFHDSNIAACVLFLAGPGDIFLNARFFILMTESCSVSAQSTNERMC